MAIADFTTRVIYERNQVYTLWLQVNTKGSNKTKVFQVQGTVGIYNEKQKHSSNFIQSAKKRDCISIEATNI